MCESLKDYLKCNNCNKLYENCETVEDGILYTCECGTTMFIPSDK